MGYRVHKSITRPTLVGKLNKIFVFVKYKLWIDFYIFTEKWFSSVHDSCSNGLYSFVLNTLLEKRNIIK